jgi:hypothetical protein
MRLNYNLYYKSAYLLAIVCNFVRFTVEVDRVRKNSDVYMVGLLFLS